MVQNIQIHTAGHRRFVHGRLADFDEFAMSADGWNLDFQQLDCGPSPGEILQVVDGQAAILKFTFCRRYLQRGASPKDTWTFGLPTEHTHGLQVHGAEANEASIVTFRPDGEFEGVSAAGFAGYTLSFREELLAETAGVLGLGDLGRVLDLPGVCQFEDRVMRDLRNRLRRLCRTLSGNPQHLGTPAMTAALCSDLPARLLMALVSTRTAAPASSSRLRQLALQRALPLLEATEDDYITIREVCQSTGVSWRTLDYAFREHFGVGPKAYLRAIRLNRVRAALFAADHTTKIADLANRWGFWHMGQFAADYRRQFGELPSTTFKRRRGTGH